MEIKEIVKKLRPVAESVYKAKQKSLPKPWYSDNCSEIEEWVSEGKTVEEISDLLCEALEDHWWGKKLQGIKMFYESDCEQDHDN